MSPPLIGRILSTVLPGVFCDFTFILNLIVYKNKLDDFRVVFFCCWCFVFYFPGDAVAKARKEYRENQ